MYLVKVENDPSLARDPNSNAILSVDVNKIQQHRRHRMAMEDKEQKLIDMQEKIEKLEHMINNLINKNV